MAIIFQKFFKPKWQHRDPAVRRRALLALESHSAESLAILCDVVRFDEEPALRQLAIKRIDDLKLLQDILSADPDGGIRSAAQQRLQHLLSGHDDQTIIYDERIAVFECISDAEIVEYIARKGKEPQLRLAALNKSQRDAMHGDIAIHDPDATVRLAAVAKIQRKSTLQRVYDATRLNDKQVSRAARERLDAILEAQQRPARIKEERREICIALEALGSGLDWAQDEQEFQRLQARWDRIDDAPDAECAHRYHKGVERFTNSLSRYREEYEEHARREELYAQGRAERTGVIARLKAQLSAMTDPLAWSPDDDARADALLRDSVQTWEQAQLVPTDEQQVFESRYAAAREALQSRRRELQREKARAGQMDDLCAQAQALLAEPGQLLRRTHDDLSKKWAAVTQSLAQDGLPRQQQRWRELSHSLQARLAAQDEEHRRALDALEATIGALEKAAKDGSLGPALGLRKQARKSLAALKGSGSRQLDALSKRLVRAARVVDGLNEWRTWANTPQKEQLCADMEALIGDKRDPRDIAREVREARTRWKALGPSEPQTEEALWERFDQACKSAYAPCEEYFTQRDMERKENLAKRETLCAKIETFLSDTDWDTVDWTQADKLERNARKQWHQLGPIDRRRRKAIQKRFDAAANALGARLEAEWERNAAKKQALIQRVEQMNESADLRVAIEEAKLVQREWKAIGRAPQGDERLLWERFRAACDRVFARRREVQKQHDEARQSILDRKRHLVEQMESLGSLPGPELDGALTQLQRLEDEWRALQRDEGHEHAKLAQAMKRAMQQFHRARRARDEVNRETQLQLLREKSRICTQLEELAGKGAQAAAISHELDEIRHVWDGLPAVEQDESRIQERFSDAMDAIIDPVASLSGREKAYTANRDAKERLCIRMEILANVASPGEAADKRLAYQVERLSQAMGKGEAGDEHLKPIEELRQIIRAWLLTGPVGPESDSALESRFWRATEQAQADIGSRNR